VDEALHQSGVTALIASGRRDVSLVDWVSFELMRRHGIGRAFSFNEDFARQGFTAVPPVREGDGKGGAREGTSAPDSGRGSKRGA